MSANAVIDIGNSRIKLGLFSNNLLKNFHSFEKFHQLKTILEEESPENLIFSSSSGKIDSAIIDELKRYNSIAFQTALEHYPIASYYKTPNTLGLDRVAAVIGANSLFPSSNNLVLDFGTCITCDLIDKELKHWGGSISPGLKVRLKSLAHFTNSLPEISPENTPYFIGRSTKESILSGVINGIINEVNALITLYKEVCDHFQIIICGGDALFFESKLKHPIFVNEHLVLEGLNCVLEYYQKKF